MCWWLRLNAEEIGGIEICVLGCLNAKKLIFLYALIITCLYALMLTLKLRVNPSEDLFFNHMCTHLNDNIFICSKVDTLTWLDARALTRFGDWTVRYMCTWMCKFSCAYMFTCFIDHVFAFILTLTIICSHLFILMITCFYVHMFWCSHASMCTCFDGLTLLYSYALMIYAPMSTCFDENMSTF